MTQNVPPFADLLAACGRSAVHLEMRDVYGDNERFAAWRAGHRTDWEDRATWWQPFHTTISDAVARGVEIRRARIVSEPVSEYIRWEHYATTANVAAGEQVRWLPRRKTRDLLLPGNDFWAFDGKLLRVHHFSGDGAVVEDELVDDPSVVDLSASAFEEIWKRAVPHAEFAV
ncbi:DUF6879 family protein [Streptomyces sp. RKAG293]|uniref:DUF6879 family protein n=1 Tax=Streptomyces sp. RKAG293 TaxID=2893403 RepID=UPI002033FFF7|nr:DUF6879 family protein [Streptomyces sp. RKAG293]MCM2420077.1 hypothetical protein [Streptomyces sp. RKAG293]